MIKQAKTAEAPLRYIEARLVCRLSTDALFSAYKGSMLRGALGASLRKGLCMTRNRDCRACILSRNCVFPAIFSPLPAQDQPAPPPFCLEPDPGQRREYSQGEEFGFNLKLFGFCAEYLPFFVQAFRMAGETGLGDPARPGKFALAAVICQGQSIYDAASDSLETPQPQYLPQPCPGSASGSPARLDLRILSPLRHKNGNQFSARLEFADLFHLILRRIRALYLADKRAWSMDGEDYAALLARAQAAKTIRSSLQWRDWTRYSSRQETRMKFGGLLGDIAYAGDIAVFANLLKFAEIAHLGKQTSFGLGRIGADWSQGANSGQTATQNCKAENI